MDNTVLVAVITVSGSMICAAITFYLTKRHQFSLEWRHEKLNHYKVLLSSLSDLAVDGTDKLKANKEFSLAVNTIGLVAPQYVITALMNYHDEVKFSNKNRTPESHDQLLKELLLAIRKDIGLSEKDNAETFNFHLMGSAPKDPKERPVGR
jgi:hypothetical protein